MTSKTHTSEEAILSTPGPGAFRVQAGWDNTGQVRTGYAVRHLSGPSATCAGPPLFVDRADAARYADLQDRLYGRPLLRRIDARIAGLPSQEEADRYLDNLDGAERWGPECDPYALYAHVLWEYEAHDTYSEEGDLIMIDNGYESVPTLAQLVAWLEPKQEDAGKLGQQ